MSNETQNSPSDVVHVSAYVSIVCLVLLILEVVAGTVGNALLCAAVYHKKSLRTPVNALVVNLSVAGLLESTVCAPMMMAVVAKPVGERKWPTGACLAPHVLWEFVSTVQLVTLVCISLERLQAIATPFDKLQRAQRIRFYIAASWSIGAVNGIISHQLFHVSPILYECRTHLRREDFRYPYGLYVLVPFILASVVVILVSYLSIVVLLRKKARARDAKMRDTKAKAVRTRAMRKAALAADTEHTKQQHDVDVAMPVTNVRTFSAPNLPLPSTHEAASLDVSESSTMESTTDLRHLADMLLYVRERDHARERRKQTFKRVAHVARGLLRHHSATVRHVKPEASPTKDGLHMSTSDRRDCASGTRTYDVLSAASLHNLTRTANQNGIEEANCLGRSLTQVNKDNYTTQLNTMTSDKYVTLERHKDDSVTSLAKLNKVTSDKHVIPQRQNDDTVTSPTTGVDSGRTKGDRGANSVIETGDGRRVHYGNYTDRHKPTHSAMVCDNPLVVTSTATKPGAALTHSTDCVDPDTVQTVCDSVANPQIYSTSDPRTSSNSTHSPAAGTTNTHPFAPSLRAVDAELSGHSQTVRVIEIHGVDGLAMRVRNRRSDVVGSICVISGSNRERGRRRIEAKTARTTLIVIVAFILSWLPLTVAIFGLHLRPAADTTSVQRQHDLYMTSLCIAILATALNPLIYGLITHQFRAELNRVSGKMSNIFAKKL